MKYKLIDKNIPLGDTLSAINYNFTCLDIQTCNLNYYASNRWNVIPDSLNWTLAFTETLGMSSNWEAMKNLVFSNSAYWNTPHTIVYPTPFAEGQVSKDQIETWLNSNFDPSDYLEETLFIIFFFEWYKSPALHGSPGSSLSRFGQITESNNVHIKQVGYTSFITQKGKWIRTDLLHIPQICLDEPCFSCFGVKVFPDYPFCKVPPTYYQLSCIGDVISDAERTLGPCSAFDLQDWEWDWNWPNNYEELSGYYPFLKLRNTDTPPYTLDITRNPELDLISNLGNDKIVYRKYINDQSKPNRFNSIVNRKFAKSVLYKYKYETSATEFTYVNQYPLTSNEGELGVAPASSLYWNLSSNSNVLYRFNATDLKNYFRYYDDLLVNQLLSGACDFNLYIETSWHRWVTNNVQSLTCSPFWHIGVEPEDTISTLGFYFEPSATEVDTATAWSSAFSVLGNSGLSAFFGTDIDMMGLIHEVIIYPTASSYPISSVTIDDGNSFLDPD